MPIPTDQPPPDPYRRRREAGAASREETRRRLLTAADELFCELGYPGTSVGAIAERACVSLQTLYLAWGNKRALLRAATDAAAIATQSPEKPEDWRNTVRAELSRDVGENPTAAAYLAAVSRLFVRVAARTGLYWRMHRQAAATDPDIAADWSAMTARRRETMAVVARSMPADGARTGLGRKVITDTLWALASPEMWELFTLTGGYSDAAFQRWLEQSLVAVLCDPA